MNFQSGITPDNDLGRKTFFWYRVYCVVMVLLYLLVVGMGLFLLLATPPPGTDQDLRFIGGIYIAIGAILFLVFAVALFLPPKPYNWIVGIVLMGLGMTSCCFLPFLVPLMIYWVKPETKAYFGRK